MSDNGFTECNIASPTMFKQIPALAKRLGVEPGAGGEIDLNFNGVVYSLPALINALLDRLDAAVPSPVTDATAIIQNALGNNPSIGEMMKADAAAGVYKHIEVGYAFEPDGNGDMVGNMYRTYDGVTEVDESKND